MAKFHTGHVGLNVTDVQRAKSFYQAVFGFNVLDEATDCEKKFVLLAEGEQLILTLWQQSNGRFPKENPGLHHLAFEVEGYEQVKTVEAKLRELDAKIYHDGIVAHREGATSGGIFFEDPDGICLEVYTTKLPEGQDAPSGSAPTCGFF